MFNLLRTKVASTITKKFIPNLKQTKRHFNSENLFAKENIPTYGAIVGVTALSFQVSVLFPWHKELSDQFLQIQDLIIQLQTLALELDEKLDKVVALEEQVKAKERKILDRNEEIFLLEQKVLARIEELRQERQMISSNENSSSNSDLSDHTK